MFRQEEAEEISQCFGGGGGKSVRTPRPHLAFPISSQALRADYFILQNEKPEDPKKHE